MISETREFKPRGPRNVCALALLAVAVSAVAVSAGAVSAAAPAIPAPRQPQIGVRTAPEITIDGLRFKDLNRNSRLDPYEDWRLPAEARADDLVSKMTPQEKAGAMQHGTAPQAGGGFGGARAYDLAAAQGLIGKGVNSLITRMTGDPSALADQNNQLQAMAEASRLGIPLTISTDPRNHFRVTAGASEAAGQFSQWPETLGLSAIGDPAVTRRMTDIARQEYRAVGIHIALSPMADLATEPRWARVTGTFGEDVGQVSRQVGAYVAGFQGGTAGVRPDGVIAVVKHWAGYGAAMDGWDSHNAYGRYAHISEAGLKNHMNAFQGAFDAKVSGVMPTYSILQGAVLDGAPVEQVGVGFSRQMLQDQLRGRYGFKGFVVSDWGIISDCPETCRNGAKPPARPAIGMPWGVESLSRTERAAKAVNAGVDQIGGSDDPAALIDAMESGKITPARIDEAVRRVLTPKFQLGLFENPYVDKDAARAVVGSQAFQAAADEAQRQSLVLLQNKDRTLPLKPGAKVFLQGISADTASARGLAVAASIDEADVVLMRMSAPFSVLHPDFFFGARQHEGDLDFKDGQPPFEALKGASGRKPVVAVVSLDRPAVLTNVAPLAAGLVADFGVSDAALLDVLTGRARPSGKLPFELPSSMEAVRAQAEERPHDSANPLFPFGFGLRY